MSTTETKGTRHGSHVDADVRRRVQPGFIPALHQADELTQVRTEKILLLLSVARVALVSGTVHEKQDGLRLLELVMDEVSFLQNEINSLAERNGASQFREGDAA